VKEESDWESELQKLLELGERLDLETAKQGSWRNGPKPGEIWKPTCRDEWIEEKLKIRTKAGRPILFRLNPVQREYSRTCSRQNIVLKARQLGITSYIAARFFVQTITRKGTLTMQVAHDRESAEEIFRIVHRFWDNLPERWQKGVLKTSHSSARELVFPRLDSAYTVASADENAGRGRTIQNLHCTEVSRWGREGEEALASLRAALVPGGEIVLESTANGAWGQFYEEWRRAEETGYTTHFFPWWCEEGYVAETGPSLLLLTEKETALAKDHGLTARQIAWRRQQWASLRRRAAQEFAEDPVSCFRASGECVFELATVERALGGGFDEPLEERDNGRLRIWLPAQLRRRYAIGADPAGGGVEGDYSCAEVIDRGTGGQCAELHGHWPPREFAKELAALGKEYNTALLAVERNNHGSGVLAHLETLKYPLVYKHDDGQAGWLTSVVSRAPMIENLATAMIEAPRLFRSSLLLNECRTFVRRANGKIGAAPGTHDDCVMAMAIAWAVREAEAGRGMAGRVGFDSLDEK
jgi:hypothetical protein